MIALLVLAILILLPLHPTRETRHRSPTVQCMNNLKHITIGFTMWRGDHGDAFPWEVSVADGGTSDYVGSGQALPQFQTFSNYLDRPERLGCPVDGEYKSVTNFAELNVENVGYFLSLERGTNQSMSILLGDRNLETNGQPALSGLLRVSSEDTLTWSPIIHGKPPSKPRGNLTFYDGHSELSSNNLQQLFQQSVVATNRLLIP